MSNVIRRDLVTYTFNEDSRKGTLVAEASTLLANGVDVTKESILLIPDKKGYPVPFHPLRSIEFNGEFGGMVYVSNYLSGIELHVLND